MTDERHARHQEKASASCVLRERKERAGDTFQNLTLKAYSASSVRPETVKPVVEAFPLPS